GDDDLYKSMIVEAIYSKSKKSLPLLNQALLNDKNMGKSAKERMYTAATSSYYGGPESPNYAIKNLVGESRKTEDPIKFKETLAFLESYLQIAEVIPNSDYELKSFWWELIR